MSCCNACLHKVYVRTIPLWPHALLSASAAVSSPTVAILHSTERNVGRPGTPTWLPVWHLSPAVLLWLSELVSAPVCCCFFFLWEAKCLAWHLRPWVVSPYLYFPLVWTVIYVSTKISYDSSCVLMWFHLLVKLAILRCFCCSGPPKAGGFVAPVLPKRGVLNLVLPRSSRFLRITISTQPPYLGALLPDTFKPPSWLASGMFCFRPANCYFQQQKVCSATMSSFSCLLIKHIKIVYTQALFTYGWPVEVLDLAGNYLNTPSSTFPAITQFSRCGPLAVSCSLCAVNWHYFYNRSSLWFFLKRPSGLYKLSRPVTLYLPSYMLHITPCSLMM